MRMASSYYLTDASTKYNQRQPSPSLLGPHEHHILASQLPSTPMHPHPILPWPRYDADPDRMHALSANVHIERCTSIALLRVSLINLTPGASTLSGPSYVLPSPFTRFQNLWCYASFIVTFIKLAELFSVPHITSLTLLPLPLPLPLPSVVE